MNKKSFVPLALLTLALAAPVQAAETSAASPRTEAARSVHVPTGVALGSRADEARYAARQAASPDARKYKGGDVIVISATAVAIVLLVVIIIILL